MNADRSGLRLEEDYGHTQALVEQLEYKDFGTDMYVRLTGLCTATHHPILDTGQRREDPS